MKDIANAQRRKISCSWQMHFCIVGYNSLKQGCGAGTEISKLRLFLHASKVFGSSSDSNMIWSIEN